MFLSDMNIENIIARSGLVVHDNIPVRGYGLNEKLSRIPNDINWVLDVIKHTHGNQDCPIGSAYIAHGKLPHKKYYVISYNLKSSRADEFGRRGLVFEYALLITKEDYNKLIRIILTLPEKAHEIFKSISPQHYDANKMPDEPKGQIILFPLFIK